MPKPVQLLLSLIFIGQMYLALAVVAVIWAIPALISRDWAVSGVHAFARWVVLSARILVGLKVEIRGQVPTGAVLIAAKHQSFFDIIIFSAILDRPRFVMKRELIYAPFLGQYAMRVGCVPVDRGKGSKAASRMKADVAKGADFPGQLVIYPQGTRVAPGDTLPYKVGAGLLYAQLGQPCHLAATNIGYFWPKRGILRKRGTAVLEFLPPLKPGLSVGAFMRKIEPQIEAASDRLLAEAKG